MAVPRAADTVETEPGAEAWPSFEADFEAAIEGAAVYLGVKKRSVYRWLEGRGLPARKVGREPCVNEAICVVQ